MSDTERLQELLERSASTDVAALLRALEEALARRDGPAQAEAEPEEADRFPNLMRVLDYLRAEGWKIGKSQLYQHRKEGRIRAEADGTYTRRAVDRYAKLFLKRTDGRDRRQDELEELQRAKLRAEKEKTEAQARHWELRTRIERGYYVRRADVEQALAARAVLLRAGYEDFVRGEADRIVAVCEGSPERVPDLIAFLLDAGEEWFDRYADEAEFTAMLPIPRVADGDEEEEG